MNYSVKSMNELKQESQKGIIIRNYMPGDDAQIVKFLNLCYGQWGTMQKWHALYSRYPAFTDKDVFILEKEGQIVGHEGLHYRHLILTGNSTVNTATLSDAATHPHYRGKGLHNRLIEVMLKTATSKGTGLAFSWYLRGTGLHAHSRKIGFTEVKQPIAYMRVIRPEKVFRGGLSDFFQKSPGLKLALQDFGDNLCFQFGQSRFFINELLGVSARKLAEPDKMVELIFESSAISTLARFRTLSWRQRLQYFALLLLLRKAKVRVRSFRTLLHLARIGVSLLGSI